MSAKHPYWPDLTDDVGDALADWFDETCGDCIEGRCHWGGQRSRLAETEALHGHEYIDPDYGVCGCANHQASVLARPFRRAHETPQATALAWRAAKTRGDVRLSAERAGA